MAYTPTTWVNNSTPAINAANLNKMEGGIEDAHDCANIAYTPFGDIIATNVQAAITELENEKVSKDVLDANSIIKADTDDTPAVLTVAEQTLVGRITSGSIDDLSVAQVQTLINVEDGADVTNATSVDTAGGVMETDYNAHTILIATADNTPIALGVAASELIGRTAVGNIDSMTMTEARTILNVEDGSTADQTGSEIKGLYEAEVNAFTDTKDTKLTGIEAGATADQTGAEIKTLYEAEADAYTDTKDTKLTGIETAADVTDATNVGAAGAVMDSDISAGEGFMRKTGAGAYEAIKSNMSAVVSPTVNEDSGDGYAIGSRWIDTVADEEYICLDSTVAAAVWSETTSQGTSGGVLESDYDANTILAATADNTPLALTIEEQTLLGRITAGDISDLSTTQVRTLINVENGATADQSNAEIRAAVEAATDSNVFTDSDHSKLNGIEATATKYPDTGEQAFLDADHTKLNGIATSANNYSHPSARTCTSGSWAWTSVTGEPSYTTRWPSWTEVTSKPSTFTPSAHNQSATTITSGTLPVARGGTGVTSDSYDARYVNGCDTGYELYEVFRIGTNSSAAGNIDTYDPYGALCPIHIGTAGYVLTSYAGYGEWMAAADLIWSDTHCPKCGEEFKDGDILVMYVTCHNELGDILTIPMHQSCAQEPKVTVTLRRPVMTDKYVMDDETGEPKIIRVNRTTERTVTKYKIKGGYDIDPKNGHFYEQGKGKSEGNKGDGSSNNNNNVDASEALETIEEIIRDTVYEDVDFEV